MITKLRPRRSQGYRLTKAGLLTGADLILTQDAIGYQIARETCLLEDCLHKLEALNNSGTHTNSQELRDRLRVALGLPLETTAGDFPNYDLMEEYEVSPILGTYSEV